MNIRFIFQNNKKAVKIYFGIQLLCIALAGLLSVDEMFLLVDFTSGLMCFINLIALIALFKQAKACMRDYEEQVAQGVEDPEYDWNKFRIEHGMKPF